MQFLNIELNTVDEKIRLYLQRLANLELAQEKFNSEPRLQRCYFS